MTEMSHSISLVSTFPLCLSATHHSSLLNLRVWNSCSLGVKAQHARLRTQHQEFHFSPDFSLPLLASVHPCHHRDTLKTMVFYIYLIHSVFLDSILATKALGIICGKEKFESESRR